MLLSLKESNRVYVLKRLAASKMTVPEAARLLGMSDRQVRRLKSRVQKEGVEGLVHRGRGRRPLNETPAEIRALALSLATGPYQGANFTHLSDLLVEHHDILLSAKTIGRMLKQSGISSPKTHRAPRRYRRRTRKPQEGLLVQMDASQHDWLEGRGPRMSLHGAIDDATGRILGLYFRPTEDTIGYFQVLWQVITRQGGAHCRPR